MTSNAPCGQLAAAFERCGKELWPGNATWIRVPSRVASGAPVLLIFFPQKDDDPRSAAESGDHEWSDDLPSSVDHDTDVAVGSTVPVGKTPCPKVIVVHLKVKDLGEERVIELLAVPATRAARAEAQEVLATVAGALAGCR